MLAEIWLDTPAEESRPPSASGDSRGLQNALSSDNSLPKIYNGSMANTISLAVETISGGVNKSLITTNVGHREERLNMEADDNHTCTEISLEKTENYVSFFRHDYTFTFPQG